MTFHKRPKPRRIRETMMLPPVTITVTPPPYQAPPFEQTITVTPPPYQAPPFDYTVTFPPIDVDYIEAASPDLDDVRAALDMAAAGDTVRIPAGEARWASMLETDAPPDLTILGAGDLTVRGGGDATVIYDDVQDDVSLWKISTSGEGRFTLAGLTFRGGTGHLKNNRVLQIAGSSKAVCVHHLTIDNNTYSNTDERNGGSIRATGWINGVIYECLFKAYQAVDVWMPNHSGQSYGDGAWAAPTGLGGSDFVFIEDCTFESRGGSICDGYAGKLVLRYCTANHANTHGLAAGRNRGVRAFEIYNNRFIAEEGETKTNAVNICSGTGVIWGNVCDGLFKCCVHLKIHRNNDDTYKQKPVPEGWGYAGTNFSGTGSPWDGNTDPETGYPALDQPGYGAGDLLGGGAFPDVVNTVTGEPSYPRQALEPIHIWENTWEKVPNYGDSEYINASAAYFTEGREYVLAPLEGYVPHPYPHPLRGTP